MLLPPYCLWQIHMDRVFVLYILKRKEIKIRLTVKMNADPRRLLDP